MRVGVWIEPHVIEPLNLVLVLASPLALGQRGYLVERGSTLIYDVHAPVRPVSLIDDDDPSLGKVFAAVCRIRR